MSRTSRREITRNKLRKNEQDRKKRFKHMELEFQNRHTPQLSRGGQLQR